MLPFFEEFVLFNFMLIPQRTYLSVEAEIQFLTHSGFFLGQCISFQLLKFHFHVAPQLLFKGIEGHFMLSCKVFAHRLLHGVDSLCNRLLTKTTFSAQISPQSLFLSEPSLGPQRLVEA